MLYKADINQITLETVNTKEAGTLGAAILAGTAVGFFKDVDSAVSSMVSVKERTTPDKEKQEIYKNGYRMYKKLIADLKECFDETK